MTNIEKVLDVLQSNKPLTIVEIAKRLPEFDFNTINVLVDRAFGSLKIKRIGQFGNYRWTISE